MKVQRESEIGRSSAMKKNDRRIDGNRSYPIVAIICVVWATLRNQFYKKGRLFIIGSIFVYAAQRLKMISSRAVWIDANTNFNAGLKTYLPRWDSKEESFLTALDGRKGSCPIYGHALLCGIRLDITSNNELPRFTMIYHGLFHPWNHNARFVSAGVCSIDEQTLHDSTVLSSIHR